VTNGGISGGPDDHDLIAALAAAVASGADAALRRHLAELLVAAGRHAEALGHAAALVQAAPDDQAALDLLGRCTAALRGTSAAFPPPSAVSGHATPAALPPPSLRSGAPLAEVPDTADELIGQWAGTEGLAELGVEFERSTLRLDDVGGMDEVKRRLRTSFLDPLQHPEISAQFGKKLRGGLMLWGPPGCGKTFIARALAGELSASFVSLGLQDVLSKWFGESTANLHQLFEAARASRPCVLFIDELDAIGLRRSEVRGSPMRNVVNQLLVELDGVDADNEGLYVLGATNLPWDVDPALLRPGRFDRMVLVVPPDAPAREAILRFHLRGRPAEGLDLRAIVRATDGCSGADLALICEHATERALEDSMRQGTVRPIRDADLADAVRNVHPSINMWMDTARNYITYANDSGVYDELAAYLSRRKRR